MSVRLPLLSPAEATQHMAVTEAWSRLDIYQFDWQLLLRDYGICHWEFDYGQGMAAHATTASPVSGPVEPIQVPAHVSERATYHLWVRYLRHPHAGELRITLDGQSHAVLSDDHSITGFVWEDTGAIELVAGDHVIGLQNRDGLTVVNALALISESEMTTLRTRGQALAAQVPNVYLLEAERDFDVSQAEAARPTATLSAGRAVVLNAHTAISTTLDLVTPGDYVTAIRASIPSGTASLTVTLGTTRLYLEPQTTDTDPVWLTTDPVHLDREPVPIHIQAAGTAIVDAFMLYTNSTVLTPDGLLFQETSLPAEISYEQIDPTRYRVRMRTERPFVLALAETYDPLWVVSGLESPVSSIPLYGVINGFFLNRTGSYEITVEYQAQQWARLGTLVTSAAMISVGPLYYLCARSAKWRKVIGE